MNFFRQKFLPLRKFQTLFAEQVFAFVLGKHISTIYHWKKSGNKFEEAKVGQK